MTFNFIHSALDHIRDRVAPISHTSTFRKNGQITPEEFVLAGDFIVHRFPSWSWADASSPSRRVAYLPDGKQFLVTRGVPCHRRLDDNFAGDAGQAETVVRDGFGHDGSGEGGAGEGGTAGDEDDGWLRTGGMAASQEAKVRDVRTVDESGNLGEEVEEEEIPDMEDEEDDEEAIIRDPKAGTKGAAPLRTYTLYITYTPYYRTPRLYLSGYLSPSEPLPPHLMMEDIIGDYKDKTVTLEDFPFLDAGIKMASVHPCKHASVMKVLLDRADAALKLRVAKLRKQAEEAERTGDERRKAAIQAEAGKTGTGMEGLMDGIKVMDIAAKAEPAEPASASAAVAAAPSSTSAGAGAGAGAGDGAQQQPGEEWEVLQHDQEQGEDEDNEIAIRVDQYLVVFLKFMASVTPGIEHDYTMGV